MAAGRFITFEGGEGCGKSTQIRILAERLRAAGKDVLLTREPGGTELAEKIRALVREESADPPNFRAETLLFLASRAQVVENVIRPALAAGTWVLCDRFADSTFAYQGYGRGLDLDEIKRINSFATGGLAPDRTVLLDVSPEVSEKRMRARSGHEHGRGPDGEGGRRVPCPSQKRISGACRRRTGKVCRHIGGRER